MDCKYQFTDVAINDLDKILNYIANELCNDLASKNLFSKIEKTIDNICLFPKSFPLVENSFVHENNIRKASIDNYIIYYKFEDDKKMIIILRIVYGRMNLDKIVSQLKN